jgi:two-component system response regulator YesN
MQIYRSNFRVYTEKLQKDLPGGYPMYKAFIVDDDRAIRYELKRCGAFAKNGFCIAGEAADGREAIDKIVSADYDIAFVDMRMPRMNGIQFIQELRSTGSKLCIVIISGSDEFSYTRQAIKLGAFDYLLKPVNEKDLDELLANAGKMLEQKNQNEYLEARTSSQLADSLKQPYSQEDEDKLYKLVTKEPDSSAAFVQKILDRLLEFYDHDLFKLSVILDSIYRNLIHRIFEEMPWLKNLQIQGTEVHLQQLDSIPLLKDAFLQQIEGLAALVKKLHMNDTSSIVKLLCEYVISNIDGKITLETAARELNYSSKHLGKAFKDATGESIVDYITGVKMERARMLVMSGKYKNYEISEILGYKNPDYFCRLFKERHGMTPLECRMSSGEAF